MVEWPLVFASEFDERFLRLPERVIVTAMQSHQRYFPLGENRFAVVADGEMPTSSVPATRECSRRGSRTRRSRSTATSQSVSTSWRAGSTRITFIEGGGSFAEKANRLVELVPKLGGDEAARQAALLSKADQASELVREFTDLEGAIGARVRAARRLPRCRVPRDRGAVLAGQRRRAAPRY